MGRAERVTITLPPELLESIDRLERNRSRFIVQAVQRELARRKREALHRSLENPHPESLEMAEVGFDEWQAGLPSEDEALVDPAEGRPVRWVAGEGWVEDVEEGP